MKAQNRTVLQIREEAGVALLIAIFILLLVSAVAITLVVASRTESSLAGNYRSSIGVYYAGLAGLEEGRGRLLPKNPNYFNTTIAGFIPSVGPLALGQVRYILNPLPGETVAPTNLGSATTYPDTEYQTEFGVPVTSATLQTIPSVSTVAGIQGPLFKWVRITAATEKSLNIDVDSDHLPNDSTTPLYYDPAHVDSSGKPKPSLIVSLTPPVTASQVLAITTLAVLPDGSEKLMQYVVTPVTYGLNFPSPLTLPGQNVSFNGANSNQWFANGTDGSGAGNNSSYQPVAGCNDNPATSLPAVGVTDAPGNTANLIAVDSGIPSNRTNHYVGEHLPTPSVSDVTLNTVMQSPSSLNQLVQTITQNADLVVTPAAGTAAGPANLPSTMSPTSPQTVVVNGDFSMSGNFTGYGLLVVTGNFAYSGTTGWDGIILVIGSGTTTFLGSGGGNAGFNGALFVATTKDASGNLLASLGNVGFNISGGGGSGIYYDSCWIQNAQKPPTYKVLSFHELSY